MASVKRIYELIDKIAPFDSQEEWDNAGLLAGHPDRPVERVLTALDLTAGVIEEAVKLDAQLIVTHHPILFHARKNLREDDPEGALLAKLVRAEKALIAAHTNFDKAAGGVNDALADALGLTDVEALDQGLRIGNWDGTLYDLQEAARVHLKATSRLYDSARRPLHRVAVCGGAGGSLWRVAHEAGADGYLTGEVKHSDALAASSWGLSLIECGHYATERASVKAMRIALQTELNALQYNVMVFESESVPFRADVD